VRDLCRKTGRGGGVWGFRSFLWIQSRGGAFLTTHHCDAISDYQGRPHSCTSETRRAWLDLNRTEPNGGPARHFHLIVHLMEHRSVCLTVSPVRLTVRTSRPTPATSKCAVAYGSGAKEDDGGREKIGRPYRILLNYQYKRMGQLFNTPSRRHFGCLKTRTPTYWEK
jgi:hypothetical protein